MRVWSVRGRTVTRGCIAHVFLAVAICLPLVAAGALIDVSMAQTRTSLDVSALIAVAVAFASVVAWMALLPAVRQVEVSTARFLLGYDDAVLPDVRAPRAWVSRARGATGLAILVGIGVVVTAAILTLVPTGLGWLTFPLTGDTRVTWPAGHVSDTGAGWHASWLIVPALLAFAGCGAVILGAARSLVALAPRVLGPTLIERVGIAAERERALARANALARDLHDQLGHTLTAMTVQVTAARASSACRPRRRRPLAVDGRGPRAASPG